MATIPGTAENKVVAFSPEAVIVPMATTTVINQGDRVKITSNLLVPTSAVTDDWIGVADFTNPVASLGDTLSEGRVLLKDNIVYFDAPATETFAFGTLVYQYATGGNYYIQAVTIDGSTGTPKLVGTCVEKTAVTGGTGVRVKVKIAPTVVI